MIVQLYFGHDNPVEYMRSRDCVGGIYAPKHMETKMTDLIFQAIHKFVSALQKRIC